MPQNPCLIASKTVTGDVHVFDYTKHPLQPHPDNTARPDIRLKGHTREGYGLSWNNHAKGLLLSGAEDHIICLWDVTATSKENRTLSPKSVFHGHSAVVGDVAWHALHDSIFGSVGDDKKLLM
jgi:histone-binding protein RBBP4